MSDNVPAVPEPPGSKTPPVFGPSDDTIVRFQGEIEKLFTPALRTLHELVEMADSEGVRLQAASTILFFGGMRPPKRRYAPAKEGDADDEGIARELGTVLKALERNRPGLVDALTDAVRDEADAAQVLEAEVVEDTDANPS